MNISKRHKPIPNEKLINNPASTITTYTMDREEINAKYGPYKTPIRKRYAR